METSLNIVWAVTALLILAFNCRVIWERVQDRDWRGLIKALLVLPLAVWLAWWPAHRLM